MSKELVRGLTLADAAAIVVGSIIATGVFLKTGAMSSLVGSPWMVLLIWVVAGLLSLSPEFLFIMPLRKLSQNKKGLL